MSMLLLRKEPKETHKEKGLVKMEAEIGILLLPANALRNYLNAKDYLLAS